MAAPENDKCPYSSTIKEYMAAQVKDKSPNNIPSTSFFDFFNLFAFSTGYLFLFILYRL